ncbi:hypothetical protein Tco_0042113, partial [Tanacetum coccineum]
MNGDAGYKSRDNTRRTVLVETSDALVVQDNALIVQDGLRYDWSYIAQDEPTEFALMAYTSNSSGSDTKKNEAVYEEKIAVLEFKVKDKGNAVSRLTNQLEQTLKEKEDLKAKLEQFETSFKNLNKLINSQISSKDKTGLGYGDQLNENDSSGSELFNSVFDSRSSDGDDNQTNQVPLCWELNVYILNTVNTEYIVSTASIDSTVSYIVSTAKVICMSYIRN